MTVIAPQTVENDNVQFLAAIARKQNLGEATRDKYERAVIRATEAGVDLKNAQQLAAYATTLPKSSRQFLRAAVIAWTKDAKHIAKANATPENVNAITAAIYRLDAIAESIQSPHADSGTKAHTWLTRPQVAELLSKPDLAKTIGRRDKLALALLVGSGLRREEAVTLTYGQIIRQGERTVLNVLGKGKKSRVVPINKKLAMMLADWMHETNSADDDHVLRSVTKGGNFGKRLSGTALYKIVQKYGRQMIVVNLQPHDLRRTYAQIGLDAGVPIQQISLLLGHSTIEVTQQYLNIKLNLDESISDFVGWD